MEYLIISYIFVFNLKFPTIANLSLSIPPEDLNDLKEEASESFPKKTVTQIVQLLIREHNLLRKSKGSVDPRDIEHVPGIKESLSEVIALAHPEAKGLIIPDMEEKPKSDPEIKEAFSLRRGNRSSTPPSTRPGPSPIKRITYE